MTSNGTQGIRKHASELIEQAYQLGYQEGVESCARDVGQACKDAKNDGITEGRNEAWEAARKISSCEGLTTEELFEIFSYKGVGAIVTTNSASEAIEKIRAYEEKKKQEEDKKIHVDKEKVMKLADEIGIHELFAIMKEIWGE